MTFTIEMVIDLLYFYREISLSVK